MACVSTKDEVSWQEAGFSLNQKLWNNTNQDLSKFTSSDLSREAEQINHGFLAVTVSKGLTSQQSQPTLCRVKPSSSTRLQRHPTSSTEHQWLVKLPWREQEAFLQNQKMKQNKQTKKLKKERTKQPNNSGNNKTVGISDWKFGGE